MEILDYFARPVANSYDTSCTSLRHLVFDFKKLLLKDAGHSSLEIISHKRKIRQML
jgi:hypothetical protein